MMMRKLVIALLTLLCLPVGAQEYEMRWENVTTLNFVATNGSDKEHALQQYLLFDERVLDRNRELLEEYKTFHQEFMQMSLNREAPQMNKEIDEMIANAQQLMKEHPELADELKEQLKEVEKMRGMYNSHADNDVKEYTYSPKEILRKMTALAVGRHAYTGYKDIGNGMFAVKTGLCYGPLNPDAFTPVKTEEKHKHTWGAIDYNGKFIIEPKYGHFRNCWAEYDFIYLEKKDKNGVNHTGALGYDGRVRLPFIYDYDAGIDVRTGKCIMCKGGKIGIVTMDNEPVLPFKYAKVEAWDSQLWEVREGNNCGALDNDMKVAIPIKYKSVWDGDGETIQMLRHDNLIDVYDLKTLKVLRTVPKPHD